jgi:hypothetical protein
VRQFAREGICARGKILVPVVVLFNRSMARIPLFPVLVRSAIAGARVSAVVALRRRIGRVISFGRYGAVPVNGIQRRFGIGVEAAQSHSGSVGPTPG